MSSAPEQFQIDITPDTSALSIFKNLTFTHWYALGEFVDNAITSAMWNLEALRNVNGEGYMLTVAIDFDDDELVITDNAAGIARAEFPRALRTGVPPAKTDRGLSIHGTGMKAAAFWWGQVLTIRTWPLGEGNGWELTVDLEALETSKNGVLPVKPIPAASSPGTEIRISKLWQSKPKPKTLEAIRSYLPSIYRLFVDPDATNPESLSMHLTFMGRPLRYEHPELLNEPFWPTKYGPREGEPSRLWRRDVSIRLSDSRQITGWVGLRRQMSRDLSGFFMHFRGKGVAGVTPLAPDATTRAEQASFKPAEVFGQKGSYRDQTIVGEIDVSAFGKTLTTDSVTWLPGDRDDFTGQMVAMLKDQEFNMWAMAENFRRREVQKDRKTVMDDAAILSAVTSAFGERLRDIDHQELGDTFTASENETASFEVVIADREGHEHLFHVAFVVDRSQPLIFLSTEPSTDRHHLQINEVHPVLDTVAPIEGPVKETLYRLCLGLAASEVFATTPMRSEYRHKFNDAMRRLGEATL